ncbi:MAG: O-antigen ligase family protein, partial [Planctomycetota bacterium]
VFPPKKIVRVFIALFLVLVALVGMKFLIDSRMASERKGSALSIRLQLFSDLLEGRVDSKTTNGRSVLAREGLEEWLKSPIYGQGLGKLNRMPRSGSGPHNLFLKILGETGLLGLFCFITGLAAMIYRGLQHQHRYCRVIILGIVLSLMLDGMAGHGALVHRNFMFALGLAMAVDYFATHQMKQARNQPTGYAY